MIRNLRTALLMTSFIAGAACGQSESKGTAADSSTGSGSRLYRYEFLKKDKAAGLAWSIIVPGGALFYSERRPELAATLGFIESLSIGTILYTRLQEAGGRGTEGDRAMTNVFVIVYLGAKAFEVCEGFALVDDYNHDLWNRLSGSGPGAAGPPSGPLHADFTFGFSFSL